jgi:glutamate--cysteine ligase
MNVLDKFVRPIESVGELADFLESGSKPKSEWRIGTEHEKFGFNKHTLSPIPYEGSDGIRVLLECLAEQFDWERVLEEGNIIGLTRSAQSITTEPGGQIELSGAPLESVHETMAEVCAHLGEVNAVGEQMGIGFTGPGFVPNWRQDETPRVPKARYRIMREKMAITGTMGRDMMFRTCTIQANLDFENEADMVKKFRVGLALQPIVTALFANSSFTEGRPNGFQSYRSHIWQNTDPARTGGLPFVFEDGFGFECYVDYALDVPMYFVVRDGSYIDAKGQTFRDFMAGSLDVLPGQKPTMGDWETHLATLFPEVRLKKFLEMRGADSGPWSQICALSALWAGILYDGESLDAAWDLVKGWTSADRAELCARVPRHGLQTPAPVGAVHGTAQDIAKQMVEISVAGLGARNRIGPGGNDESQYLESIMEIADSGRTHAQMMLAEYEGRWDRSVAPILSENIC